MLVLYNDAYASTIGRKHSQAVGRRARTVWLELWDDLGPMLQGVLDTGRTIAARDRPFEMDRRGFVEQMYFDISYSPLLDDRAFLQGFCAS